MAGGRERSRARPRRIVRSEQWWDFKVPPVVAIGALAVGLRTGPASTQDLVHLVLVLVSAAGVAAFGHLVNDWCDVGADAAGGKANQLASWSGPARAGVVAVALVAGLVPWVGLAHRGWAYGALALEVVLLVAYSAPPLRLKGRRWAGALADAAYAYAVPFLLVAFALGPVPATTRSVLLLGALGVWGLLIGLRGILSHQLVDAAADRAAGVRTVVTGLDEHTLARVQARFLLPLEIVVLLAAVALYGRMWVGVLLVAFVIYRWFQARFLWTEPLVPSSLRRPSRRVEVVGFDFVNEFLERWLPLAALVAVAWSAPWWWLAVGVHLAVFRTAVRHFLAWDVWVLPDGLERLVFARRARTDAVEVARRRREVVASGPDALADPTARRWVFVVCGPAMHVETLATALGHLRPVTEAEIWVITDTRRNERPIGHPGIDHVVDVATPTDLDDHQASIWLKTSVHRHLPVGEWCYLDSDIIAVAPGGEAVFDERQGPVAFASDVTIRDNSVDRFSPWAMTCACLGYDDEHSCGHLREQLVERFDVEVPGDWLHWNGGVFVFGPDAAPVLDLWHERAVASFAWPEWKTRDQGALISTVWSLGLQDLPRLSPTFNFIADLGNHDLCLEVDRGWAHHPAGPWYRPRFLHLYTSPLEDPEWELGRDVEAVVLGRSRVRILRHRRGEAEAVVRHVTHQAVSRTRSASRQAAHDVVQSRGRWVVQERIELYGLRLRRLPRRFTRARLRRAVLLRLGRPVDEHPAAVDGDREPEPQRSEPMPR